MRPVRPLVASQAARNIVLAKQHLLSRVDPGQWRAVPRGLVGVHAARFKSPIYSLAARVNFHSKADVARQLYAADDMIKIRCMRGTLHIVPLDMARVPHSATWRQRKGVCDRLIRAYGMAHSEVEATRSAIANLLAGSRLTAFEIEAALVERNAARTPMVRSVLKMMWESGELCYLNSSGAWATEERRYAITAERYGTNALPLIDETEAEKELIRYYFAAYGPATIADAAWWSGLSMGRVAGAVRLIEGLIEVHIPEEEGPHLIFAADLEKISANLDLIEPSVRLLAWEDNLLKGYMPSRRRFAASESFPKVFNAIGEARATVLSSGRVIGTWTWNDRASQPNIELFREPNQDERNSLTQEVNRLVWMAAAGG